MLLTSTGQNGNFTLLLTMTGQEWQFHIATDILWSRMAIGRSTLRSASRSTPKMHHGIYIMGCIWQPFCILQEKVGISCYFKIIKVVNNQLAWYSHVRCNPPWHPQHPQNTTKNPPHHNYKFQLWGLIFARFHMSYCCESWSWQICQQIYPHPQMHHGIYIMGCI